MKHNLPAIPDNSLEYNIRWWAIVLNYNELYFKLEQERMKIFGIPEQYFGKVDILDGEKSTRKFKWNIQK